MQEATEVEFVGDLLEAAGFRCAGKQWVLPGTDICIRPPAEDAGGPWIFGNGEAALSGYKAFDLAIGHAVAFGALRGFRRHAPATSWWTYNGHRHRKPKGCMKIGDHAEVGIALKRAAEGVPASSKAFAIISGARSTLVNWCIQEHVINFDQANRAYFCAKLTAGEPMSLDRAARVLEEIDTAKRFVSESYQNCPALRRLLKRLDRAEGELMKSK